jgi:DNA-binding beta-propeller fold protein YncE
MSGPDGVATDSGGNVFVIEFNNHRVQKFNSSGTWERAWGKNVNGGGVFGVCTVASNCLAGSTGGLGGEMNQPFGLAADANDNVYVSELSNQRIEEFDSSGTWERAWGKNVNGGGVFGICTVASSCLAGSTGGLGGEMNFPVGVASDSAGAIYLSDTGNSRIQRFGEPIVSQPPGSTPAPTTSSAPTGQRARAIRKCKRKFPKGPRRNKCLKKAKGLPV